MYLFMYIWINMLYVISSFAKLVLNTEFKNFYLTYKNMSIFLQFSYPPTHNNPKETFRYI